MEESGAGVAGGDCAVVKGEEDASGNVGAGDDDASGGAGIAGAAGGDGKEATLPAGSSLGGRLVPDVNTGFSESAKGFALGFNLGDGVGAVVGAALTTGAIVPAATAGDADGSAKGLSALLGAVLWAIAVFGDGVLAVVVAAALAGPLTGTLGPKPSSNASEAGADLEAGAVCESDADATWVPVLLGDGSGESKGETPPEAGTADVV
jgi:hypothetical protein